MSEWLIGLPSRKLVTDESGNFVSESRIYYDGSPFIGLPLGQVGLLGDLMREERLLNGANAVPPFGTISKLVGDPRLAPNVAINASRSRYDQFGNLVESRDPLYAGAGQGHSKEYAYAARSAAGNRRAALKTSTSRLGGAFTGWWNPLPY